MVVSRIEVAKVCHDCKVSGSMVASDVATSKFHNRRMKALGVTLPLRPREVGGDKLDHRVRMESVSMKYSSVLNVVGVRELDEDEVVAEGGLVLLRMNDGSSKGIGLAPRARLGGRSPLSLLPQPIMVRPGGQINDRRVWICQQKQFSRGFELARRSTPQTVQNLWRQYSALSNFYLFYFSQRTEEISHRNHNVAWGGIFPGKPRELYAIAAGINNSLTPFCRTPTNPKSQP